jgi:hypothetical protein
MPDDPPETELPAASPPEAEPVALSQALLALASAGTTERVTLQDLLDGIKAQARPALLILFALPNSLPSLPGISAITGLPLVFLTLQMMLAQPVRLPGFIAGRSLKRADLLAVMRRTEPWLARIERILTPRLLFLSSPPAERLAGACCLVLSLLILAPVPFGNILPAITIILIALGFLERDGYFILAGIVAGWLALALVVTVYWAVLIASLLFLFGTAPF